MSKILIAVDHRENCRLLMEYLGQRYNVAFAESAADLNSSFDLGVFDGHALDRLWRHMRARKTTEEPLFLGVLLVTPRQDVSLITRQLWRSIDELIFTPIEKIELLARVEVLLRTRRLSLELAGKNIQLQAEIITRKQAEDALRESEERTRLLQQLTASLATTITPIEVSTYFAQQVMTAVGGHLGTVALINHNNNSLELLGSAGLTEEIAADYKQMSVERSLPITDAFRSGEPVWIQTLDEYISRYPNLTDSLLNQSKSQAVVALPLNRNDQTFGAMVINFPNPIHLGAEEQAFFIALAQQCTQALERARLYEEVRNLAVMEERQRLARDLHDAVTQTLFSITMHAQSLPRIRAQKPEQVDGLLATLITLAQAALAEMRTLLLELRPAALINTDLKDLLTQLGMAIQGRRAIAVSCVVDYDQPLPEDVHLVFYRIAQESINNIVKHSKATQADITVRADAEQVILSIRDNGLGFDSQVIAAGLGLNVMGERAAAIGATFDITSAVGEGTQITVEWPFPS